MEMRSLFLDHIKAKKFQDAELSKIHDKVLQGEANEVVIDSKGVQRIKGCVFTSCW